MIHEDDLRGEPGRSAVIGQHSARDPRESMPSREQADDSCWVIETAVCPFHCLYQDALLFHTQSRLARSESDASRIARAALLLYVSSAESLAHQAAIELGRPELSGPLVNPDRPITLFDAWRLLPAIAAKPGDWSPRLTAKPPLGLSSASC